MNGAAGGTLTRLFFDAVEQHASQPAAFRYKAGGVWTPVPHREAAERVRAIALGLRELGIAAGDRVAILAETRLEWALVDYACLCARAADVPIYPTLPANQVEYILRDSGAAAVFCSTAAQLAKVVQLRGGLPALKHVIVFEADAARDGAITLADVEAKGRAAMARYPRFKDEALAVRPDDLATLIYTSGTTGTPKGVMLSHNNLWSNVVACVEALRLSGGDSCLACLPLSHIFERMVDYYFFHVGVTITYAQSIDTLSQDLRDVHPTVFVAVPRIYEKVYGRVLEAGLTETSPVLAFNPYDRPKFGTVGKPIPGVQVKIAPDGEILAKGPNIMRGYYNLPDATREAIDAEGWFHTGDIGEFDAEGYLKI